MEGGTLSLTIHRTAGGSCLLARRIGPQICRFGRPGWSAGRLVGRPVGSSAWLVGRSVSHPVCLCPGVLERRSCHLLLCKKIEAKNGQKDKPTNRQTELAPWWMWIGATRKKEVFWFGEKKKNKFAGVLCAIFHSSWVFHCCLSLDKRFSFAREMASWQREVITTTTPPPRVEPTSPCLGFCYSVVVYCVLHNWDCTWQNSGANSTDNSVSVFKRFKKRDLKSQFHFQR